MNRTAPSLFWWKFFSHIFLTTALLTGTKLSVAEMAIDGLTPFNTNESSTQPYKSNSMATIQLPSEALKNQAIAMVSQQRDITNSQTTKTLVDVMPAPPPVALGANYITLTFHDEFNSIGSIDVNNTHAPGYNWYVQLPFGWGAARRDTYEVTNGVLIIGSGDSAGWVLSTWSGTNGNGHAFRYGYFEARVHFDPTKGPISKSWPAFWSFPVEHAWGPAQQRWNELDFFEAFTGGFSKYDAGFYGTVHDWAKSGKGKPVNHQNHNNYTPLNVDWNQWHVVGCLWMPGKISWYLDDTLLKSIRYSSGHDSSSANGTASADSLFSIMDRQSNLLVLGSSTGWHLYVDYVRVWQK